MHKTTRKTRSHSKSGKGWKVAQFDSKNKRKTQLGLAVLLILIAVILIGQVVNFFINLHQPLNVQTDVKRGYEWENKFNLNVIIIGETVALLSFNPTDKTATLINIPNNTYLNVPKGFGLWQLRAIYPLGQQNNPPNGNLLLEGALQGLFGVPIDGTLEFKSEEMKNMSPEEILEYLKTNPFNVFYYYGLQSDLTPWELIQLKFYLPQVRFDKIKIIDLLDTNVLDETLLADNTQVFVPDEIKVDDVLQNFIETEIRSENKSIAIFNATSHPGLAQKAGRIVKNLGGNIIFTTNSKEKIDKTIVLGENSFTFEKLEQIFGLECSSGTNCDKISDQEVNSSRADINIVLGEDFYSK